MEKTGRKQYLIACLSLEVEIKDEYLPEVGEQCPVWTRP